jgi:TP901 family phage tail tape measure protein
LPNSDLTPTEVIAASTDAIVDLSTATGENLAGSATVAAATLRAFGLEATEMTRVVDVMAGSFVRSGLDLEKFRESMKLVAPIARATNVDIETTTAALSKLADAGLSGSLAGTALRNLLSNMADPTSKLATRLGFTVESSEDLVRAFKQLRQEGVGLAEAVQLVDVRARPAFFTILNNIDAVEALSKEYRSLTGEGQRIAEMMRDTLANDIEIANSAFDAMRRNMIEGLTPSMRETVQGITDLVEYIRLLSQGYIINLDTLSPLVSKYVEFLKVFSAPALALGVAEKWWEGFKTVLRGVGVEINDLDEAQRKSKFSELTKQAAGSIDLFNRSVKAMENKKLLDEYKELEKQTNKTSEQLSRVAELENNLRVIYGDTAIAIDKVTGKYFLNTEAIDRSIKSTSEETKTVVASYEARLQAIDSEVLLFNERRRNFSLQGDILGQMKNEAEGTKNITELLEEKRIILEALAVEHKFMIDESVNGWGVYKEGAKGAKDALEELAKAEKKRKEEEEKAKKIAEEARKQREKAEAEARKQRAEELKLVQSRLDLQVSIKESQISEIEGAIKVANAEGDKATALRLGNKLYEEKIQLLELVLTKELEGIRRSEDSVAIKNNKELIAYQKHYQSLVKLNTDYVSALISNNEKLTKEMEKAGEAQFKASMKALSSDPAFKAYKERRKLRQQDGKDEATLEAEKARLYAQSIQAARRAFDTFFEYRQSMRQTEIDEVSRWEDERIKLAGDNQEAISAIREEADARRRVLMNRNARDERAAAMFNIALNTAQAIVAALKLTIGGIPLSIAIGAIGAAQLAMVASKPLPQFAKGTDNAPEGNAIVGEKGREIIWDRQTNTTYLTPDSPTVTYLSKGSVVIPNEKTEKLLSAKLDRNEIAYDRTISISKVEKTGIDYTRLGATFEKAVTKIPLHQTTFDADGVRVFVKKGNNRTERLNRRYRY